MSARTDALAQELEAIRDRLGEIVSELRDLSRGAVEADAPAPGSPLIDAAQAAARLGLTKARLYARVRAGEIPAVRLGERSLKFAPEALDAWVRSGGCR